MSWYTSCIYSCQICNYEYVEDISTFTVAKKNPNKCLKCGGEVKILQNHKEPNHFIEILKVQR